VAMFPERVGYGLRHRLLQPGQRQPHGGQSHNPASHHRMAQARVRRAWNQRGPPVALRWAVNRNVPWPKTPMLLLPTSALERVGVYPLNESGRVLIELLESDELTCSLMIYSFSGISSRRTARGVTSEDMLHEEARRLIKIAAASGAPRLADVPLQTAREMDLPSAEVVPLSTGDEAGITVGEVS